MTRRPLGNDDDETAQIVISVIAGLTHDEVSLLFARTDGERPIAAVFVRRPHVPGAMRYRALSDWLRECADDLENTVEGIEDLGIEVERILRESE